MRTLKQLMKLRLFLVAAMLVMSSSLHAQTMTTHLVEDFSSGEKNFPPDGWNNSDGGWFWIPEGYQDYNGSAVLDLWNWYQGPLYTPTIDASMYTKGDKLTVEFDVWMEHNMYHDEYGLNDHMKVYAVTSSSGQKLMLDINTGSDYTYYNDGYFVEPYGSYTTSEKNWRHYVLEVPADAFKSDLRISFAGEWEGKYSLSNFAIDNVVISGVHYRQYSYSPGQLNFGDIEVGGSSDVQYVTLKNSNPEDMDVWSVWIDGVAASEFEITEAPKYIPGGSSEKPGEAVIGVRFNSNTFGTQAATLMFTAASDVNQEGNVALRGTGVLPAISVNGARNLFARTRTRLGSFRDTSFLVTHSSQTGQLIISSESYIDGEFGNQYSIVRLPSHPLNPGQSDTVTVRYAPSIEGGRWADLVIMSNGGNGPQRISLRGTGILQRFTITPSSFEFDSTEMGTKQCQTFTLANPGSDTLHFSDIYFTSADADFTLENLASSDMWIAPERSREIKVCFEPRRMGARQARLRIVTDIPRTYESNPRDTSTFNVNISGVGVPFGELTFEDIDIDSGVVGEKFCKTETITNVGDHSITVTGATILGPDASDFSFSGVTFPITLATGASTDITICATPGARGERNAYVHAFTVSNSKKDTIELPLEVFGQEVCANTNVASLFDDELVVVGETREMVFEVRNCGDVAAIYTAMIPSGSAYTIVGSATSPLIPAGGNHTYSVLFTPTTRGAATSNVQVSAEGLTSLNVALNGVGAGVTANTNQFEIPKTMVGDSKTFDVVITNNGNIAWNTGGPTISSSVYSTTWTGATIAPGGSETVTFTFSPTVVGFAPATVTFASAAPTPEPVFVINFNGEGVLSSVKPTATKDGFSLEQNYPNPVANQTAISFTTPRTSLVTVALYDAKGELVKTVTADTYSQGTYTIDVNSVDLSSGTYFYVLSSDGVQLTRQMTVVK